MNYTRFIGAFFLVGCSAQCEVSTGGGIKMDKVRELLATDIAAKLGAPPTDIKCPEKAEMGKGKNFSCSFKTADGAAVVGNVVQNDDEGNVTVTYEPGMAAAADVTAQIKKNLSEKLGGELEVDCGTHWRLQGQPFTCQGKLGDKSGPISVTWEGTQLQFSVSLSGGEGDVAPPTEEPAEDEAPPE